MPESPHSAARAMRAAVADRLRDLRLDAGLTGRELARRCGWHESKSSRIEAAVTRPSDADIQAWASACGAERQSPELIEASRSAESMYILWRKVHRAGMRHNQQARTPLYEQARTIRVYCANVIPGLLQTVEYGTALLKLLADFGHHFDDAEEGASARAEQFQRTNTGNHRFAMVVEEDVLYHRFGVVEVMAGQLGYLLTVMGNPRVSFGVIPRGAERTMWPAETFMIFDDHRVEVELLTAAVTIRTAAEIGSYARAFATLSELAVYGDAARALIAGAITSLG